MNPSSSLGPRLNAIYDLVKQIQLTEPYPCIWDCCCDHGYLGIKIMHDKLCKKLVFVDQVAHIIDQLRSRLAPFSKSKHSICNHELITSDAGDICFDPQQRHLVILAGVGGERTVEIIRKIERNHKGICIDYIFCPSTSQNALREYLDAEDFGMAHESLVYEKKRFYEVLYVQRKTYTIDLPSVSLSCDIWNSDNPDQQRYLQKIKRHQYKKQSGSKS